MRVSVFVAGVSLAAIAASPVWAGDKVLFGPPPAWVVEHPALASAPVESDLPVQILQLDTQVHAEGKTVTRYAKVLIKFVNAQGLGAGNLSYSWSPETDDLTVHKIVIHRGAETIDVLSSGQTFTVMRREQNLEQATLTGQLTANMFPEGLQAGDVLETETSQATTNPVTGDHAEDILGPYNFPAGRVDASVEWPKGKAMRLAKTPDLPEWKRGERNGFETASLSLQNVQPLIPPNGAPGRFGVMRLAEATDYASWAEIADVFVPLYQKASRIPADGPLRVELDKIRAASADPVKRAEGALQLVESRTRYVALEMGTGGLVPADAADTWARRFGDCKAKTALLLGLLRELGIDAEPVVVSTALGDAINDRLPAISLFNHILVRATIAGRTYWLDGTRTGDTSLARLTVPNFGWGLPIHKGSAALIHLLPATLEQPDTDLTILLDATKGIRGAVPATLEMVFRGDGGLGLYQALTNLAGQTRDQAIKDYWHGRYDFIQPDKVAMAFDDKTGELHLTLQGTAKMDWDKDWYETDAMGVGYRPDFTRAAGAGHDSPFSVAYPYFEKARETILLPPGFDAGSISGKPEVNETVAGIEYKRHASFTGNRFVIERTERSLVPELPYKDAVAAEKRLRDLREERVYLGIPHNYRPSDGDLAAAAADTSNDDAAALVTLGNSYMNAGKNAEALERFVRATGLDPKNALAWADRGIAEAHLGKLGDAEASLDKAAGIEPQNEYMFHGRGIVAEERHSYAGAIDAYTKAIAQDAKDGFAFGRRASANYGAGNLDAALADAQKATELDPKFVDMYSLRAFIFIAQKKPDAAAAEVQRMIAANPGNVAIAGAAKQMLTNFGMADKAKAIVGTPVDGVPTAQSYLARAMVRDEKDTDGRLADLGEALKLDPDFLPALSMRASLRYSLGQFEAALADADRAPGRNPHQLDLYLIKANLLRNLGKPEEALAVAKAMTDANPEVPYAYVAAGKIYQAFDDHAGAVAAIDRAIALAPEPYMYLNRADIRPLSDLDARLADVEQSLKMDSAFTPALAMKADLLSRKGDHAAAARIYDAIVAKEPTVNDYLVGRGIERWRAGQHDEAEKDFAVADAKAVGPMELNNQCYEKAVAGVALEMALKECNEALRLQPDVPSMLDSRATVYLQMGRYAEAKADYDRALAKYPNLSASLLGRAIARFHLGDMAGARTDIAAARKASPAIVEAMRSRGFAVPQEIVS